MCDFSRISHWKSYEMNGLAQTLNDCKTEAINYLSKKASKASFCIRKAIASKYLNVDLFLKLYEQCVKPTCILLYCSEVWCLDKVTHRSSDLEQKYDILPIENVQLNFCKIFAWCS